MTVPGGGDALSVRERDGRPYVEGLARRRVTSASELSALFVECAARRATAATAKNPRSSRSHAVCVAFAPRVASCFSLA